MSTLYPDLQFTSFPNNIQTFITMLNIVASDGNLIKQYQEAMENGDTALAQSIYTQIPSAYAKFVDATKLNTLMQTCVGLQRFYKTDIEPYIETKQEEWQDIIDEFDYQGVYVNSMKYEKNNFVLFNSRGVDLLYICTNRPPTTNIPPTNQNYWRQLTIQGTKGETGVGLSFLYEWNSATTYSPQDLVSYNNALWGCVVGNQNQPPSISTGYWKMVGQVKQAIYPLQNTPPTGQVTGDLWFRVLE